MNIAIALKFRHRTNTSRKKLFKICKGENTENVCFVVFCVCKNPARLKQSTDNFQFGETLP